MSSGSIEAIIQKILILDSIILYCIDLAPTRTFAATYAACWGKPRICLRMMLWCLSNSNCWLLVMLLASIPYSVQGSAHVFHRLVDTIGGIPWAWVPAPVRLYSVLHANILLFVTSSFLSWLRALNVMPRYVCSCWFSTGLLPSSSSSSVGVCVSWLLKVI